MAEFAEALGDALAARYRLGPKSKGHPPKTPITQQRGLLARMNRIMAKFKGNRREAAKAAGIPYTSWNRMLRKGGASDRNRDKVAATFSRLFTAPALAALVAKRGYPSRIEVKAVVVCDPKRSRYINGRPPGATKDEVKNETTGPAYRSFNAEELEAAAVEAVVDAWVTGGADGAADEFLAQVKEEYTDEFGFEGDNVEVILHD